MSALARLTAALEGRYRVEREIGAGGMATVFLAHDLKHERDVAIKVLHPDLGAALGAERFLSEIKTTARLQHPHILPLLDSGAAEGLLYYVMPYVRGETLRTRLEREQQLAVSDAVLIAREVADALEHAHAQGIVHRDIKPENILVQDGHALVADFGIALAVQSAGGARMTQTGLSLGTPQYMAPEQAMGDKAVGARADVYALGAVTYEMLTGEPPYTGQSAQAIVAKLLTDTVRPLTMLRPSVPSPVDAAVRRALEKLPADRFASARAYADALTAMPTTATAAAPSVVPVASARRTVPLLAAALLATAGLAAWGWMRTGSTPDGDASIESVRFTIESPGGMTFNNVFQPLTISPNGRTVIWRAEVNGTMQLVRRDLDRLEVMPIPGTEQGSRPSVSPNGEWLAFTGPASTVGRQKVPFAGGGPITTFGTTGAGASWVSEDSIIVAEPGLRLVSATVSDSGRVLLAPDSSKDEVMLRWPKVIAGGTHVLYASFPRAGIAGSRLGVLEIATGKHRVLDVPTAGPIGYARGHAFVVTSGGVLMAVPLDVARMATTGPARALLEDVNINSTVGAPRAALADNGTLVYLEGRFGGTVLVFLEGDAISTRPVGGAVGGSVGAPVYSPDALRVALEYTGPDGRVEVAILDVATGQFQRFGMPNPTRNPVWSGSGRHLYYLSVLTKGATILRQAVGSTAVPELVLELDASDVDFTLSSDERWLVVLRGSTLWIADLTGDRTLRPLDVAERALSGPAISPDGKWLAYSALVAGTPQVYVRPFRVPGRVLQLSEAGGLHPSWSADGRTLYYLSPSSQQLLEASLTYTPAPRVVSRRVLRAGPWFASGAGRGAPYTVGSARRQVGIQRADSTGRLIVITNWVRTLKLGNDGR